jgi:HEAT repeat protein
MGIMTDKQFEEFLRNTAQDYNRPPENTPHTEIWANIDEARHGSWQREQWREATPWWSFGRGIAATAALWLFPLTAVAGGAALAINHWTGDSGSEFTVLATEHGDEHEQHAECNDVETRVAALNALLQMENEQAMPILMDVLERRDVCSVELRRRAVFLISQHETRETVDILLRAVREDPDHEVQEQAVFWLGQTSGDDAVTALESILQGSENIELQKKVVFSLSQHGSSRAGRILRDIALDSRAHEEVRDQAIFWLGQEGSDDDVSVLMDLYDRIDNDELKERIVFAVSQSGSDRSEDWLVDLARDDREPMDLRENAVFWLGQRNSQAAVTGLASVLMEEGPELQEKAVFALSQHGGSRAMLLLRDVIGDSDMSAGTREQAIFWLGQEGSSEDVTFLMGLYNEIHDRDLKEKIIFAVSQNSDRDGDEWLLSLARDENEAVDLRKNALFWAGQEGDIDASELRELYNDAAEFELKEHVIFVLSQFDEGDAVDELMDIARNETNADLRDKAIFWLGQSDDERAAEFLAELINRPTR